MQIKRKHLAIAVINAVAVMASGAVYAQSTPQKVEKVEVTGSNIKRIEGESANPVQVISRQEIERAGVSTVNEVLQRITGAVEAIRDMNRQIATAAEEQTSVAEDISRNLTEITAIATTNQENVQRTESASHNLHDLSAQLSEVTSRLSA